MPKPYKDFEYKNKNKDPPEQIYEILRCGLVHSFDLSPSYQKKYGRYRSILISNSVENLKIIDNFDIDCGSAILVFDKFIKDIDESKIKLFSNPKNRSKIDKKFQENPPIQEIYNQRHSINPSLLGGISLENSNSYSNITAESASASG